MAGRRAKPEKYDEALGMFLDGTNLRTIAEHFGFTYSKVRKWSTRNKWSKKRDEMNAAIELEGQKARVKYQRKIIEGFSTNLVEQSQLIKKLTRKINKKIGDEDKELSQLEIGDIVTSTEQLAKAQKAFVGGFRDLYPEVSKELITRLVEATLIANKDNRDD